MIVYCYLSDLKSFFSFSLSFSDREQHYIICIYRFGRYHSNIPEAMCDGPKDRTAGTTSCSYYTYRILNSFIQTFEPSATEEKKVRNIRKYIHQETVGFRITGFKTYNRENACFKCEGKDFGRSLAPESVQVKE